MDAERERAIEEAYALYVRLRSLAHDLPPNHPARPSLLPAVEAAYRHWLALAAPPEDRVLDVRAAPPVLPRGTRPGAE